MTDRARPVLAAVAFACAALLGAASAGLAIGDTPPRVLAAALCSQGLWASLALGGAALQRGRPMRERLGLGPGVLPARRTALAVAGFVAVSHALHQVLVAAELRDVGALARLDEVAAAARGAALPVALLALGVAPGLAEELLFRGFVQRGLAALWGAAAGVLGGAVAFALAHGDPIQGSAALGMGLYLGALSAAAGSVRPAMVCHVVNNTLGVLAAALGGGTAGAEAAWHPAAIGGLALLGLGALGVAIRPGAPGETPWCAVGESRGAGD